MQKLEDKFPEAPICEQPRCPTCATPMDLARIQPDKRGFDLRTFECSHCEHSESWVVKDVQGAG